MAASDDRLARQVGFLAEADKLKTILRRTPIADGSRPENSAEHSWHLVLAAMTLAEYAPPGVNLARVLELLTIHDLVEIDAGDTFAYDTAAYETKAAREDRRGERIFGLLPPDQTAWCFARAGMNSRRTTRSRRSTRTPWTGCRRCS